ncbi:MAG: DUF3313 family protein, partial [Phycisphaerales bacterium]
AFLTEKPLVGVRNVSDDRAATTESWDIPHVQETISLCASMEAEGLDSQTGDRVRAVVDSRKGDVMAIGAGLKPLGHAKQVIDYWIERFVKRVDQAHGYSEK